MGRQRELYAASCPACGWSLFLVYRDACGGLRRFPELEELNEETAWKTWVRWNRIAHPRMERQPQRRALSEATSALSEQFSPFPLPMGGKRELPTVKTWSQVSN